MKLACAKSVMSAKSLLSDGTCFAIGSVGTVVAFLLAARTRFVWNLVTPSMTL